MPKTPDTNAAPAGPPAEDIAPAPTFAQRAGGLAELVREHPKTAIAAGAMVAAGVAAAIPLARRARANGSGASESTSTDAPARKRPARSAKKR